MLKISKFLLLFYSCFFVLNSYGQPEFRLPMKIAPHLSGNFGELRNNHFHSGIDFKTQKRTGIPVYSVGDGWISRIRISAWGFGYALYISHPNGLTSVYAHLDKYASPFEKIAVQMQYERESFELDTLLPINKIKVTSGQLIAYSGNSGTSSAPHLHFEIRDTKTEEILDPLKWFQNEIRDNIKPSINEIMIYQFHGNDLNTINSAKTRQAINHFNHICNPGLIGIGVKAFDHMNYNTNLYGVKKVRLFMNDNEIYNHNIDRFAFSDTRYINSMIDYQEWNRNKSLIMKCFIEPGNKLSIYGKSKENGYIKIETGKTYKFRLELSDLSGNKTETFFTVTGNNNQITKSKTHSNLMEHWKPNNFRNDILELYIPAGSLYNDIDFSFRKEKSVYYSDIFHIHNSYTPVHSYMKAKFRINADTLKNKKSYYLAKKAASGRFLYLGGSYIKGWIYADIRDFGAYTILADTVSPKITPINIENSVKNRLIRIRISDNASGIKSWKGTIDGNWVLFKFDIKTARLNYIFDDSRLKRNKNHQLKLVVFDSCGNKSEFEHTFYY